MNNRHWPRAGIHNLEESRLRFEDEFKIMVDSSPSQSSTKSGSCACDMVDQLPYSATF